MAIEIPAGVGRAESALRKRHVAQLHESAANAPAEHARYLTSRGQKMTRAMPVREYVERRRKLTLAASAAGNSVEWDEGRPVSVASSYRAMIQALDAENVYPDGLVAGVDRRILSGSPSAIPDLAAAVEEAAGKAV